MAEDEQPELPPEVSEPPSVQPARDEVADDDPISFDIIERKKPYLIAEVPEGFELWDERDLDQPVATFVYDDYDKASLEIDRLAKAYRRGTQAWFRRSATVFLWMSVALGVLVVLVLGAAIVDALTGPSGLENLLLSGGFSVGSLVAGVLKVSFGICVVTWAWTHLDEPLSALRKPGRPMGRTVKLLCWTGGIGLVLWVVTGIPLQYVIMQANREFEYAPGGLWNLGLAAGAVQTGFYFIWTASIAGLVLIAMRRTLVSPEGDATPLSPEEVEA